MSAFFVKLMALVVMASISTIYCDPAELKMLEFDMVNMCYGNNKTNKKVSIDAACKSYARQNNAPSGLYEANCEYVNVKFDGILDANKTTLVCTKKEPASSSKKNSSETREGKEISASSSTLTRRGSYKSLTPCGGCKKNLDDLPKKVCVTMKYKNDRQANVNYREYQFWPWDSETRTCIITGLRIPYQYNMTSARFHKTNYCDPNWTGAKVEHACSLFKEGSSSFAAYKGSCQSVTVAFHKYWVVTLDIGICKNEANMNPKCVTARYGTSGEEKRDIFYWPYDPRTGCEFHDGDVINIAPPEAYLLN